MIWLASGLNPFPDQLSALTCENSNSGTSGGHQKIHPCVNQGSRSVENGLLSLRRYEASFPILRKTSQAEKFLTACSGSCGSLILYAQAATGQLGPSKIQRLQECCPPRRTIIPPIKRRLPISAVFARSAPSGERAISVAGHVTLGHAQTIDRSFDSITDSELAENIFQMTLDCGRADSQAGSDLTIRHRSRNQR